MKGRGTLARSANITTRTGERQAKRPIGPGRKALTQAIEVAERQAREKSKLAGWVANE